MGTLLELRHQIDSAHDLLSVVKTMKAVAATSIWHFEEAVTALASYRQVVELGLQILLRERAEWLTLLHPGPSSRLGGVIIGSDQGLVGRFNDEIVDFALAEMDALHIPHDQRRLIAAGRRVENKLRAAGQQVVAAHPMPTSLAGIRPVLQEIMNLVEAWWLAETVDHIDLFYNFPLAGSAYEPRRVQLLPVDLDWLRQLRDTKWAGPTLPLYDQEWEALFADLIQEYFFVAGQRAFAASLAAENASRLASMEAAEGNIEERLDELQHRFHRQRQSEITAELLDIVTGAEAAGGGANL